MEKSIQIKNDLSQLPLLHAFLDEANETYHLHECIYLGLKLALEEAVVNIISYAYPGQEDQAIRIGMEYQPGRLTFVVTDFGIPFDPTSRQEPDISLSLDERPVGGLGTYLVKQLMTDVSYRRVGKKNILTLIKDLT